MHSEVIRTVSDFVFKAKGTDSEGTIVTPDKLTELNGKLTNPLPNWFIELYAAFPLSGSQLEYPQYEPEDDYDGCVSLKLATPQDIVDEMELCYPGIAIKGLGYFCIAVDLTGSGDQYYTTSNQGENPPVFQVFHDVSDEGEEIEKHGMEKIADTFADFFAKARLTNY